jgi:hypothetical protein
MALWPRPCGWLADLPGAMEWPTFFFLNNRLRDNPQYLPQSRRSGFPANLHGRGRSEKVEFRPNPLHPVAG